jgi:hypothetical protein
MNWGFMIYETYRYAGHQTSSDVLDDLCNSLTYGGPGQDTNMARMELFLYLSSAGHDDCCDMKVIINGGRDGVTHAFLSSPLIFKVTAMFSISR